MDDATYHALARHEHEVKARVYAKHGLFRRADSHLDRAAYHASFGAKSRQKPKKPKVKGKEAKKKVKVGLGEPSLDTSDTELDGIPDLVSDSYPASRYSAHAETGGWRPSLHRVVDDSMPTIVSRERHAPKKSPKYSRRYMGSSNSLEWG